MTYVSRIQDFFFRKVYKVCRVIGSMINTGDHSIETQYHLWYYNSGVWNETEFLGIKCLKSVSDMWNYQEVIHRMSPSLVLEFGTNWGGSALFFSIILQSVNPNSKVFSVDISHDHLDPNLLGNTHIEFMKSSSTDPRVAGRIAELREEFPGPVFAILDSDHSKSHVLAEMEILRPLLKRGDYVIVEDSNINGHPVLPSWGDGPYEAIESYFERFPNDFRRDKERERKFGFTFAPRGFLIRQ